MIRYPLIFLLLGLCAQTLSAQRIKPGTTRAVIVGVSNYQDEAITDLQYAHKDAEAFANWFYLNLADSTAFYNQVHMYTDSTATNANIGTSIEWLAEESKKEDKVFIYLAGHGDVETKTKFKRGYFLPYDSRAKLYRANAYAMRDLEDMIETMTDEGVEVFLFMDACRSGTLAGSDINGTEMNAASIVENFNNTIKVLSCQPNERSLEGATWGKGRGNFSYHLENALYGDADTNKDLKVDILELTRYLQDNVSMDADPESQLPIVLPPSKKLVTFVNDTLLALRRQEMEDPSKDLLATINRGTVEEDLAAANAAMLPVYEQFKEAIDGGRLLNPLDSCADHYYKILIAENSIAGFHGLIKRRMAVALLDEGQQIFNKIIETDPKLLDKTWGQQIEYDHLPAYFSRAIEILGEDHHLYPVLKAKELYFQAKTIRLENHPGKDLKWRLNQQIKLLQQAIDLEPESAVLHYELGNKYPFDPDIATEHYEKSCSLSPKWVWGQYSLGAHYHALARARNDVSLYNKAIQHLENTVEVDSTFLIAYNGLSIAYEDLRNHKEANHWMEVFLTKIDQKLNGQIEDVTAFECSAAGTTLLNTRKYIAAKQYLELGEDKSKGSISSIHQNLGLAYTNLLEFKNAVKSNDKLSSFNFSPEYCDGFNGSLYFNFLNQPEKAEAHFSKMKYANIKDDEMQGFKLEYYYLTRQYNEAIHLAKKCLQKLPEATSFHSRNKLFFYLYKAESYKALNKKNKAKKTYEFIIDHSHATPKTFNNVARPDFIYKAIALHRLGKTNAFSNLLRVTQPGLMDDPWHQFNLARIYSMCGQKEKANSHLSKAIYLGWQPNEIGWVHGTLCDHFLDPIRETDDFRALVEKHFPEYLGIATR